MLNPFWPNRWVIIFYRNQSLEPLEYLFNLFKFEMFKFDLSDQPITTNGKPQTQIHWFFLHMKSCTDLDHQPSYSCCYPCLFSCLFYLNVVLLFIVVSCYCIDRTESYELVTSIRVCEQWHLSKASVYSNSWKSYYFLYCIKLFQ